MKIAVIGSKGLPAHQGGIEHHCKELYSRMVERGHSVDMFARSSYTHSPTLSPYYSRGIQVIPLPAFHFRGLDAFVSAALGAIVTSGIHYDVIHFHAVGPSLFCWLPSVASSSKIIVTCHGLDWSRAKWGNLSKTLLLRGERTAVDFAHSVIVVSEDLKTYFKQTYNLEATYIPNAPASYSLSDPNFEFGGSLGLEIGKYIVFLGRLVPEKRPELLIQAFQAVRPQGWKLVILGDSSDTSTYKQLLNEQAADDPNIIFTGVLWGSHLAEIMRGAGLFVLPSDVEGLPLALLEAMQEGLPVLASNIPVHRSLLADGRGLLFQAGDLNSCIERLSWALQNRQEMQKIAQQGQDYVKTFYDWEQIVSQTLEIYLSSCSLPRRQLPMIKSPGPRAGLGSPPQNTELMQ